MHFVSTQIKGKGRGRNMGVPTVNLKVPENFQVQDGVYACMVGIDGTDYKGALHIGPVPTFHEKDRTIEVYILNAIVTTFPETHDKPIRVDVRERIRDVETFKTPEALVERIAKDVQEINKILK